MASGGGNQQALAIVQTNMSIATQTSTHRLLAFTFALSFGIAACSSGETIDAGGGGAPSGESTDETPPETLPAETIGEDVEPESTGAVTDGFTPMTARTDLVSLQVTNPDQVIVDPNDETRVLIHFVGAAEPCSGAAVTLTETDGDVTVLLETGLDPNAAAMSCIAQVFDYEIVVQLDAPLGERAIVTEASS